MILVKNMIRPLSTTQGFWSSVLSSSIGGVSSRFPNVIRSIAFLVRVEIDLEQVLAHRRVIIDGIIGDR